MTLVLGARVSLERAFLGSQALRVVFGIAPVVAGVIICSGANIVVGRYALRWVAYGFAALGTFIAVVSDVRQRR